MSGGGGRSPGDERDAASSPAIVELFDDWLASRGCGSYTQRSYAQGVRHFLRWLKGRDVELEVVDRQLIVEYVTDFRRGRTDGLIAGRQPRTVNHRISVLAAFFAFLAEVGPRGWGGGRSNPLPAHVGALAASHGMPGRDAPPRARPSELRQRVPRRLPRRVEPEVAVQLIENAQSQRDRALLTLLWRTGQRIGDWSDRHGRHGVLGMALGDLDRQSSTIMVRLKGARDEHRVPVSEDFWPLFTRYVQEERGLGAPDAPAWVALRRGAGRPLGYPTFESQLRALGRRIGVRVTAHMFRHALAQALVDTAGLKVAQEVLGHAHLSTTASSYARVDERAMVDALARVEALFALDAGARAAPAVDEFVFAYDAATVAELDAVARGQDARRP